MMKPCAAAREHWTPSAFDGDKSPAESADKSAHSSVVAASPRRAHSCGLVVESCTSEGARRFGNARDAQTGMSLLAAAVGPSFRPAMDEQLKQYIPVLLLGLVALAFAFGTLALSVWLGWRRRRNPSKDIAYECGMLPIGEGSTRMSVKFYLVAMLFILFDIEVVFLYPWAVVFKEMLGDPATRNLILASMVSFLAVLFVGYLYALKKRAFDWKS